jgi:pyruvate/2-oxoglutarate dehydrogenase complex dihydrolipoamide dehydrogenase (E3) component
VTETFHTIVIGAGSGGLTVAVGLANLGKPVAVIEALHVGGDCTNVGCVPSKTLIHQAEERGAADATGALAEVRRKRDALREKETHEFGEAPNLSLIFGRARLLDRRRVAVQAPDGVERILSAEHIVIATGARPRRVHVAGLTEERILTNETIFELPEAPRHLAILGGGVIGMELAFAFRKLGSRVSVITTAPRVMDKFIPEVAEALGESLTRHGIAVYAGASAHSYDEATQTLRVQHQGELIALDGVDYVLMAIGRQRNLEGLGLEAVGVTFDPRAGIPTDSFGRTDIAGVYAIGDVTPTSAFTHSANAQGRRVAQRIAFPLLPARAPEPHYPSTTFSDPEVATAGMSRQQIAERFHPDLIKRIRIDLVTQTDRGYTDDLQRGFIIVDAIRLTGRILSATIVGPRASEMISLFTLAIQERISLYRLYRVVYPYPTFSSGIQKVADTFLRETLPNLPAEVRSFVRYRWARSSEESRTENHRTVRTGNK